MTTARELLEGDFDRGESWNPKKDPSVPNPLYGRGVRWSQGPTAHGTVDFLTIKDDDGVLWSIIVGSYRLRKELLEGEVSVWNDSTKKYQVLETRGPVRVGELVAIHYQGEEQYTNKEGRVVTAPKYRVIRREAAPESQEEKTYPDAFAEAEAIIAAEQKREPAVADDGIPW